MKRAPGLALTAAIVLVAGGRLDAQGGASSVTLDKAALAAEVKNDQRVMLSPGAGKRFLWVTATLSGAPQDVDLTKVVLAAGPEKLALLGVDSAWGGDPTQFSMIAPGLLEGRAGPRAARGDAVDRRRRVRLRARKERPPQGDQTAAEGLPALRRVRDVSLGRDQRARRQGTCAASAGGGRQTLGALMRRRRALLACLPDVRRSGLGRSGRDAPARIPCRLRARARPRPPARSRREGRIRVRRGRAAGPGRRRARGRRDPRPAGRRGGVSRSPRVVVAGWGGSDLEAPLEKRRFRGVSALRRGASGGIGRTPRSWP